MPEKTQKHVPRITKLDAGDPELQQKLEDLAKQLQAGSPAISEKLGKILKRRGKWSLKQYLKELRYAGKVPDNMLDPFMDWLITQRFDMKDQHATARQRLRDYHLKNQDESQMTADYIKYCQGKEYPPDCGNCLWLITAPEGEEKTCMERGSKGIDRPCFGFTRNPSELKK